MSFEVGFGIYSHCANHVFYRQVLDTVRLVADHPVLFWRTLLSDAAHVVHTIENSGAFDHQGQHHGFDRRGCLHRATRNGSHRIEGKRFVVLDCNSELRTHIPLCLCAVAHAQVVQGRHCEGVVVPVPVLPEQLANSLSRCHEVRRNLNRVAREHVVHFGPFKDDRKIQKVKLVKTQKAMGSMRWGSGEYGIDDKQNARIREELCI